MGADYLHDGDAGKADGARETTVVFTPNLPREATYEIRLWWTPSGNRAAEVPVTVGGAGGPRRFLVDQRKGPGGNGFALPGTFRLPAGRETSVTIGTAGTVGHVVADAVQFVEIDTADGPGH